MYKRSCACSLLPPKKPLLACNILHSLPGRVRIGCRAFRYLVEYKSEIENRIASNFGIQDARVATLSENVLIRFDTNKTNVKEVFEVTETIIGSYSAVAYKLDREEKNKQTVQERRLQEESIGEMVKRIGINAATF